MRTKNLPLIVGISLPIIFIVVISIVIFTPSLFIKPQHNFLYTTDTYYYDYPHSGYENTYKVENHRIVLESVVPQVNQKLSKGASALYLYDVIANTSRQITLEEAQGYVLEPGPSSPDGYTVEYQYGHDGIFELFGSSNNNDGYFISKDNGKKKLNGLSDNRYWNQGEFKLIGWLQ